MITKMKGTMRKIENTTMRTTMGTTMKTTMKTKPIHTMTTM